MKNARFLGALTALAVAFMMFVGQPVSYADEPVDYGLVYDGSGLAVTLSANVNQKNIKPQTLAAIKQWRKDALDTGVKWPEPDSPLTMKEFLKAADISEADYLNPQWSEDMEYIAIIRALETSVHGQMDHMRLNGEHPLNSISRNGNGPDIESIAWGPPASPKDAIEYWASEKPDWVNKTEEPTGHYEYLIDPELKSYGLGSVSGLTGKYTNIWVGIGNAKLLKNKNATELAGTKLFPLRVSENKLDFDNLTHNVHDIFVEDTFTLKAEVQLKPGAFGANQSKAKMAPIGTWRTQTPEIVSVDWKKGIASGLKPGKGKISFKSDLVGTKTYYFPLTVKEVKVVSVAEPDMVSTPSGTAPELPKTVTANLNNGKTKQIPVTWKEAADPDYYKARLGGKTKITGMAKDWAEPIALTVNVEPAKPTAVEPKKTEASVDSGTKPVLPKTAKVTWSNGDTTDNGIEWDAIDAAKYKAREGGTFTVAGLVKDTSEKVEAVIQVNPATVTGALNPDKVETVIDTAPELPKTAKVTWSNGDTSMESVTWDKVEPAQYGTLGTFSVKGMVKGQSVTVKVGVLAAPVAQSVGACAVDTYVGEAPKLPGQLPVTWSDGKVINTTVSWDAIDKEQYAQKGKFDVKGDVTGFDKGASCTVNVVEKKVATTSDGTSDKQQGDSKEQPEQSKKKIMLARTGLDTNTSALIAMVMVLAGCAAIARRRKMQR